MSNCGNCISGMVVKMQVVSIIDEVLKFQL